MVAVTYTVAFEGVEAKPVEVQCAIASGLPAFNIVGLPNKAVSEAKERVRAAMAAINIAMPAKRITVNLSPADMPKDGSHFDLPIAVALLSALGMIPEDEVANCVFLGELSLNAELVPVTGCLPAAMTAATDSRRLFCPLACGAEAAWVDATQVLAAKNLGEVLRHLTGHALIPPANPGQIASDVTRKDMAEVKGQERAKRALEIAAAGRHHILLIGSPGAGKSMLAARLPGIMPPLTATEALETSMIHSLTGLLDEGGISASRPFREPHHTSSMAAIVGGGRNAKPGEISLAHNGVLFMDEFPEFPRNVLETLRQPIETGEVVIARANAHVKYPCRFMLVAAANPCRCGYLAEADKACGRAPDCGADYLSRISGPLMDRFDLHVDVPQVHYADLENPAIGESSAQISDRILMARAVQAERFKDFDDVHVNADAEGRVLEDMAVSDTAGMDFMRRVAERFNLTARGYHRLWRVARTIADLEGASDIAQRHISEAVSFRLPHANQRQSSQHPLHHPRNMRNTAAAAQPAKIAMVRDKMP